MELRYQLNEQDLLTYYQYYYNHSEVYTKQKKRYRLLVPVTYVILAFLLFVVHFYVAGGILFGLALLWYLFSPKWLVNRSKKLYKKLIQEGGLDLIKEPLTLRIEKEGIYTRAYIGESTYLYKSLGKIIEDSNHTYIFIGKQMALILPHREIAQKGRDEFVGEVKKRIV